ncbi:MAG TPA: hypothetical protein VGD52_16350 [Pseudoduganella sp.]
MSSLALRPLLAAFLLSFVSSVLAAKPVLLTPERVWTGEGAPHSGWSVLVVDGKVAGAGPTAGVQAPADADRVSLPGKTLLPGLMDLHSHVLLHPYNETNWDDQVLKEPEAYRGGGGRSDGRYCGLVPCCLCDERRHYLSKRAMMKYVRDPLIPVAYGAVSGWVPAVADLRGALPRHGEALH